MTGEVITTAIYPDGRREIIEEARNLVVNTAYAAMASAAMEAEQFFAFWAVGDGGASMTTTAWDAGVANGSIAPAKTNTALDNEVYRKAILPADMVYIDATGAVSATPTNRVRITVLFEESEAANTFLREWGIFGPTGRATLVTGSGLLINRRVHATYEKTDAVKLERVLKFSF